MAAAAQPSPKPLSTKERAKLFAEHLVMLHLGKACYKRADLILDVALELTKPGDREKALKLTRRNLGTKAHMKTLRQALKLIQATVEGREFAIADKFAKKNSLAVGQNARRFEIVEIPA